jgi:hypothetical protein
VLSDYTKELEDIGNISFYEYIVTLAEASHNTVETIVYSASFHFVLYALSLEEEEELAFQVLSLIYIYPMASFDIYVKDVSWFVRHHYPFIVLLHDSGYLRADPMNPHQAKSKAHEQFMNDHTTGGDFSNKAFVNIRPVSMMSSLVAVVDRAREKGEIVKMRDSNLCPKWGAHVFFLPIGATFTDPRLLMDVVDVFYLSDRLMIHLNQLQSKADKLKDTILLYLAPHSKLDEYVMCYLLKRSGRDEECEPHESKLLNEQTIHIEDMAITVQDVIKCATKQEQPPPQQEMHLPLSLQGLIEMSSWQRLLSYYCTMGNERHP